MTASNLGVIANVRGDDAEARRYFEIGSRRTRGSPAWPTRRSPRWSISACSTCTSDRYDDADRSFAEARELAETIGEMGMLDHRRARDRQAARCIRSATPRRALRAQRARDVATRTGIDARRRRSGARGRARRNRACDELAAAESHFLRAEDIALQRSDLILQGETARELAALYRSQGRNRQTLQRLNQAHRLFAQLRARRELADVDRRTAMLESDFIEVVRRWGESIESKDIYTQGHCVRVADLACALWARASARPTRRRASGSASARCCTTSASCSSPPRCSTSRAS